MSDLDFNIKIASYLAVGGATLIGYSFKKIKKKTKIKNISRQVISAASAGSVELEVVAWPLRAQTTSMKGEKIVFRHMKIQKLVKKGKGARWETVWAKGSTQPFLVFDHSGYALVNPQSLDNNETSGIEDLTEFTYSPTKLTSSQLESLNDFYDNSVQGFSTTENQGILSSIFSLAAKFRILERTVSIGCPLLIHGYLTPEDSSRYLLQNEDLLTFKGRVEKLIKNKSFMLTVFDKDHDGFVDAKELYNGFRGTLKASISNEIKPVDFKSIGEKTEKVYGSISGHSNQELQLTDCFEEQILKSRPIYLNWLGLYAGAGLIILAVYMFLMIK